MPPLQKTLKTHSTKKSLSRFETERFIEIRTRIPRKQQFSPYTSGVKEMACFCSFNLTACLLSEIIFHKNGWLSYIVLESVSQN